MKFCKNLQRVVDLSDPSWGPYFTNYKMLKKLIKELPSLVPSDDVRTANNNDINTQQEPSTADMAMTGGEVTDGGAGGTAAAAASSVTTAGASSNSSTHPDPSETIGKSPGEVAFFKLLHAEFKKATYFFDRATEEFAIREERVREGMEIMRQPNSIMVNEKWSLMAKSIYRLYKELLLLETFAIMTYCSFSKILKKHDKVTGYDTKNAFMSNIVNRANFTHYPKVLAMISRCERLYEEVSSSLLSEGKHGLYEDERLFINMIHRLNEQVLGSEDSGVQSERKRNSLSASQSQLASKDQATGRGGGVQPASNDSEASSNRNEESAATSALRSLVESNDLMAARSKVEPKAEGTVSEEHCDDDDDDSEAVASTHAPIASETTKAASSANPPSKKARLV